MRIRRHFPPPSEWSLSSDTQRSLKRWGLAALGALVTGYLTAYLVIFPAPLLPGHRELPRVLGLSQAEAQSLLDEASMRIQVSGTEPHLTAPQGTVIWQDPPPGLIAPENTDVTLVMSAGPPKIPIPDVTGLDGAIAQRLIQAAGLAVSRVDSLQAPLPRGVVMVSRPPGGSMLTPGGGVTLIVSRGAATISVPDLLGLAQADARSRLELEGLRIGAVTRQRTDNAAPGTVVAQRPAAGTLAASGTIVDIVVARSPQ